MRDVRKLGAVDLDGVITKRYVKDLADAELTDGCAEALRVLDCGWKLVCFTARHDLAEVEAFLEREGIRHLFIDVTNRKPRAAWYLDDRAVRFNGNWAETTNALLYASPE